MRMTTTRVLASLAVLGGAAFASAPAHGAGVTDVADAADGDDPFDANLELGFLVHRVTGTITRENTQIVGSEKAPRNIAVRELGYENVHVALVPRLEVGLFHDLALFASWPIVLYDDTKLSFAQATMTKRATTAADSTLVRDQAVPPRIDGWNETGGGDVAAGKFGFPAKEYNDWRLPAGGAGSPLFEGVRQNFDNPTFGLRFSPLNNDRDDTKPTITLQADFTPSLLPVKDPTNDDLSSDSASAVADGAHRAHFSIAMSKRVSIMDPYFVAEYTLPFASSGAIRGYAPPMLGGFTIGTEIVPFARPVTSLEAGATGVPEPEQKFAIDVALSALYVARGRDYSEVSDFVKELTYVDQHVRGRAHLGISFRVLAYLSFDVAVNGTYTTPHLLTSEEIGFDGDDADAKADLDVSRCTPGSRTCERNEFFNPILDTPGRRLHLEEALGFDVLAHIALTF